LTRHSADVSVPLIAVFLAVAVPGSAVSAVIRCSLWFAASGRAPFPTSYRVLTTNLDYKNTWHITADMQYRLSEPWLLNFEVAYDSGFQNGPNVSLGQSTRRCL
jgi:hypothetical protein